MLVKDNLEDESKKLINGRLPPAGKLEELKFLWKGLKIRTWKLICIKFSISIRKTENMYLLINVVFFPTYIKTLKTSTCYNVK